MRHSSISVGNEEQVVMAEQATSTATAGTGLLVLHVEFYGPGLADPPRQTKDVCSLKGEIAVKNSLVQNQSFFPQDGGVF